MNQVTVNSQTYRIGKMPARTQFHVLRRLMPLLASVAPSATFLGLEKGEIDIDQFFGVLGPLSESLARMNDADLDFVINASLANVTRGVNGQWAPVLAVDGRSFMFEDMDMSVMLKLTIDAIKENYGNFFDLLDHAGLGLKAGPAAVDNQPESNG